MPSLRTIGETEEGFPVLDTFVGDGLINRANGGIGALDDDSMSDFNFAPLEQHMPSTSTDAFPSDHHLTPPRRKAPKQFMRRSQSYTSVVDSVSPLNLDQLASPPASKQQRQRSLSSSSRQHPDPRLFRNHAIPDNTLVSSSVQNRTSSSGNARRRRMSDSCVSRPMRERKLPESFFKEPKINNNNFTQGPSVDPIWTRNIPQSPRAVQSSPSVGIVKNADVEQLWKLFDVVKAAKEKKNANANAMLRSMSLPQTVHRTGMPENLLSWIEQENVAPMHGPEGAAGSVPGTPTGAREISMQTRMGADPELWALATKPTDPFFGVDFEGTSMDSTPDFFIAEDTCMDASLLARGERQLEGPELTNTLSKIVASFG